MISCLSLIKNLKILISTKCSCLPEDWSSSLHTCGSANLPLIQILSYNNNNYIGSPDNFYPNGQSSCAFLCHFHSCSWIYRFYRQASAPSFRAYIYKFYTWQNITNLISNFLSKLQPKNCSILQRSKIIINAYISQ